MAGWLQLPLLWLHNVLQVQFTTVLQQLAIDEEAVAVACCARLCLQLMC
jgi:hypothetical protein